MKMANFERKYSNGYSHMICIGKRKIDKQKRSIKPELSFNQLCWFARRYNNL